MPVRDTSLIALERYGEQLEGDKKMLFEILLEIGPTHDRRILQALNRKEETILQLGKRRVWEIMSVTGRRNDLVALGVVEDMGTHQGYWPPLAVTKNKKKYHIWRIRGDARKPEDVGWHPVKKLAVHQDR